MRRAGFSLVEALVALVLASVGIVAAMNGVRALADTRSGLQESERLEMLAIDKLNELIATGGYDSATEGTFEDRGFPQYRYEVQVETTTTETVRVIRVVASRNRRDAVGRSVERAIFEPSEEAAQ